MKYHSVVTLPISQLEPMLDNINFEDEKMFCHLMSSLSDFGNVQVLVVRRTGKHRFQVISGNWRLRALIELGYKDAQCIVVELDDARAKLLSQALNAIHGEDDPGLKAESMRVILEAIPRDAVLKILPESTESLNALSSLGQADMAQQLQAWQAAQAARLKHLNVQLTPSQLEVVEEALSLAGQVKSDDNPNARGNAVYEICRKFIELIGESK